MEQKDFEQIIEDYDFACKVAKRYGNKLVLSSLYELFDELGYRTYNFSENELFDMEIGNLILTYSMQLGGIDKTIQVWYAEDWYDTTIEDFKNNLGLAMLSYTTYKNEFYKDHDKDDDPICFDEFLQNEWQDEEIKKYYINELEKRVDKKILDECNMTDLKYNHFNDWLVEVLDYQCNIVFEKDEYTEEYKQLMDERSVDIQFVEDKEDKDFPVAVFMKIKGSDKVEYVDNITQSLYERRYE